MVNYLTLAAILFCCPFRRSPKCGPSSVKKCLLLLQIPSSLAVVWLKKPSLLSAVAAACTWPAGESTVDSPDNNRERTDEIIVIERELLSREFYQNKIFYFLNFYSKHLSLISPIFFVYISQNRTRNIVLRLI
jgi:hypothetical protein